MIDTACPIPSNSSAWEVSVYLAILAITNREIVQSVRLDEWSVIRNCPNLSEDQGLRASILKSRRRAAKVGRLIGATAYTPRIVFLAGCMLRSLQKATHLRAVFDPSLSYTAGASLASWFAKREWLSCIMFGWGAGGIYWAAFRVRPP